jgi:hypothetical protein
MAEPELADFTTMNDERSDGVGRVSERPLIHPIITEPVGDFEHLPEGVRQVHAGRVDGQFHTVKIARAYIAPAEVLLRR